MPPAATVLTRDEIIDALGPLNTRFIDDGWGHMALPMAGDAAEEFSRVIEREVLKKVRGAGDTFTARWETCPKCTGTTEIEINLRGPNYEPIKFACDKCQGDRPGFVAVPVKGG